MLKKYPAATHFLLIIYSLILLLAYFVSGSLYLEWIVSFMPFFLAVNLILITILLVSRLFSYSHWLLYIVTILMFVRFTDFALVKPQPVSTNREIKVLFFNKLNYNEKYEPINLKIREINPDIIGMAELKKGEEKRIDILNKYTYIYQKDTRGNGSLSLFSKYQFSVEDSSYVSYLLSSKMQIDGMEYHVFVFHPVPPTSGKSIKKRDKAIRELSAKLSSLGNANVIAIGDFNITPWSPFYIESFSQLKNIENTAKGSGLHITYRKGPLKVPIDFIFVSSKFNVESFKSEYVEGSDHNLIWSIIRI